MEDVLQMVEPIMEGSDDEFGDIQEEELHVMQEDEVADTVYEYSLHVLPKW